LELDGMRLAESECDGLALEFCTVANANDVKLLLEAGGDAGYGVSHERASETMQRAVLFGGAESVEHTVLLLEGDAVRQRNGELSLGALHIALCRRKSDFHARGEWNWFTTDT